MKDNAYRLSPAGLPEVGIPGVKARRLRFGRYSNGNKRYIDFKTDGRVFPRSSDKLLLEAASKELPGDQKVLVPRGGWAGALLAVSTFDLEFDPEASSYFGDLPNLYAGAEVLSHAFVQVGDRRHACQKQLIAIPDGKFVIVADRGKRYVRVSCDDCKLSAEAARKEELGHLLVRRAEIHLFTVSSLRWTWHTLRRLDLLHFWSHELIERLRKLELSEEGRAAAE